MGASPAQKTSMSVRQRKATLPKIRRSPHRVAGGRAEYALPGRQIPLFGVTTNGNGNSQAAFRDPAFGDNKSLPIHRWVPWIAGYSAAFVDDVITTRLPYRKAALVLDPFCGVGTTLLQAVIRGHNAVGFEINPYPALAARAKLNAPSISLPQLDRTLTGMQRASARWKTAAPPAAITPPPLKSRIPFFSPGMERQVLHALAFIGKLEIELIANLFRAAFGAVMVSFSNYSYEPSLGSRPAAGKPLIHDADVGRVLLTKLHQMRTDIA